MRLPCCTQAGSPPWRNDRKKQLTDAKPPNPAENYLHRPRPDCLPGRYDGEQVVLQRAAAARQALREDEGQIGHGKVVAGQDQQRLGGACAEKKDVDCNVSEAMCDVGGSRAAPAAAGWGQQRENTRQSKR